MSERKPEWNQPQSLPSFSYRCGYCDHRVSSPLGWFAVETTNMEHVLSVRICPECSKLTHFVHFGGDKKSYTTRFPGSAVGNAVQHLPADVDALYGQARECFRVRAHTAAVLCLRKLLMHVAVEKKAPTGRNFLDYVNYLDQNQFLGAGGKAWVDMIRKRGNEATHEIVIVTETEALDVLAFAEMLLKLVYEFPSRAPSLPPATTP